MSIRNILLFGTLLLIISACSSGGIINLTDAKKNVENYYQNGNYDRELNSIVQSTIDYFDNYEVKQNDAVVFDVDETVLSNFDYIKSLDYGYEHHNWIAWLNKAEATQIVPAKRLYDYFIFKGFKVVFITGRYWYSYDATHKNLINQGFKEFDTLICRSESELKITMPEFKSSKRKELTLNNYNIIASIGDQDTDFEGGYSGKIIKFPNFIYKID